MLMNEREVRTGKILVKFFFSFFFVMDRASGEVHKLAKKNKTNIFPVRTEQASSIKDYYGSISNFSASIEHLYRLNVRARY